MKLVTDERGVFAFEAVPREHVYLRLFGAMEVMVPSMLTGMLAGMVVAMQAASAPVAAGDGAGTGAAIGVGCLALTYLANARLTGGTHEWTT